MPGNSPLKLFVSHSSKTDEHLQLLKDVCHALGQQGAGFHVLVDQNGEIPIGEEWFKYLAEWMAECDAAIILFTEEAFQQSQWVRAEAAILSWRKRIQPDFKLFAVLLDGVDPNDYAKDEFYNVIRFADFQHIRDCRHDAPAVIIQKIQDALGNAEAQNTPFQRLITKVSDVFSVVPSKTLENVYKQLESPHKPIWRPGLDYSEALARMLFRDPNEALDQLQIVLSELAHIPNFTSGIEILLEMLKGMWVDPEAAATLSCCSEDPKKPFVINACEVQDFTGPCYLRRAWAFPEPFKIVPAGAARTESELNDVLLSAFEGGSQSRAKHKLKTYSHPLVLLFSEPDHYPDEALVNTMLQNNKNLTVLIASGENIDPMLKIFATPIEPLLEPGVENKQYDAFDEVKALIY